MNKKPKTAVLWTGGKDCCLAMQQAAKMEYDIDCLVTFAPPAADFKAHSLSIMALQAKALGMKHVVIEIGEPYEEGYRAAIADLRDKRGIQTLVTGDIDLVEGMPNWVRKCCDGSGVEVVMPLWHRGRKELLGELFTCGWRVIFSCVKKPILDESFLGKELSGCMAELEKRQPAGLDICGENGEFHTLVLDGPGFEQSICIEKSVVGLQGDLAYLKIEKATLQEKNQK